MGKINNILELNFIGSDSIMLKGKKLLKSKKYENTVCSNCGSNVTSSHWFRTYNEDGSWDVDKYHCRMCHTYFNYNTGKFLKISKGKKVGGHEDTVCCDCGSNSTNSHWLKKYDENGNWDGKSYVCNACYCNPACRSGELNSSSNTYKRMIGVETVAKVLGDKDCTIMKEGSSFDICSIQSLKYGKIKVKTVTYNPKYGYWVAGNIKPGLFDILFILCADSKFKNVIRVYIIDGIEVGNVSGVTILRNPLYGSKYEEFRVNDITQYQKTFQIVKNESQISKNYVDNGQSYMSTKEKGDICEEIVRIAINAKISTNIYYDLVHEKYKKIEVKGSDYSIRHKYWVVGSIESFKFDTLFIVCMGSNFEKVERIYIIPKEDVGSVKIISIFGNVLRGNQYERFRVKDIRLYQEACKEILSSDNIYV